MNPSRSIEPPDEPADAVADSPPGGHWGAPTRAVTDDLTGTLLRGPFVARAETVLARRKATDPAPALLIVDVDHFKLVNDTFGHLQGDDVLRSVADVLRGTLRDDDVLGRYGGDEFVVLLPESSGERAMEVGERLRMAVEASRWPLRRGGTASITLSIGIAIAGADDGFESLFTAADRALYESKRAGRNSVSLATGSRAAEPPQLALRRFVGRVAEVQRVIRLLDDSAAGNPRGLVLVGEAGVGKSTLLRQLQPEVRLRGGALVLGRCVEADVKPPYGPWGEVLAAITTQVKPTEHRWGELARLLPTLAEGLAPPSESGATKFTLFQEIVKYIRLAAQTTPLMIVLDDMQWADAATWDVLEHLIRQLEHDRILLCLTLRSEDAGPEVTLRRRRLSRDERFDELQLARLSREEVGQWITAAAQGEELGRDILPLLYRQTEGNPFVVVQLLRHLVDIGEIQFENDRWTWRRGSTLQLPVAVNDLMARRLDRLSPQTRAVLTTAAVIGREFDLDLAVQAGAGSEDELIDAIDEATAAAVLERSHDGGATHAFAHSLLVDAILATANPRRLRRVHGAVAHALEARAPNEAGRLALHFEQGGLSAEAYRYAMLAGERARSVYAHDEAAGFFTIARRTAATPRQRMEAAFGLASAAESAARYADAAGMCDEALAEEAEDADAALLLTIRRTRERLRSLLGAPVQDTVRRFDELLREAEESGFERERITLLTLLSQTHLGLGSLAVAERLSREAVARAEALGDERLLADASIKLGLTLARDLRSEALAWFERANAIFAALNDRHGIIRCQINIGLIQSLLGKREAGEEAYRRAAALGHEAHAPDLEGIAAMNLGVIYIKSGRLAEARAQLEEARRLFRTTGNEQHGLMALYNLANLTREEGDDTSARELYTETASIAERVGHSEVEIGARAAAALCALRAGELAAAFETVDTVHERLAGFGARWFQGREQVEALLVHASLAAGDAGAAINSFQEALDRAGRRDEYGAAWLVAELAPWLAAAGHASVWNAVQSYASLVDSLDSAPLSSRFAALMRAATTRPPERAD